MSSKTRATRATGLQWDIDRRFAAGDYARGRLVIDVGGNKYRLSEVQPQAIDDDDQYDVTMKRFSSLVRKGKNRSSVETRMMKLLAVLVQDYDRRHALPPARMTPREALGYLLETSGKTPVDLLGVFGQRSHVHEALNGTRRISANQARKLGALFRVDPGMFI